MPTIKCKVIECRYNKNVMCDAPMVQVEHDGVEQSKSSSQTQCETFKPQV